MMATQLACVRKGYSMNGDIARLDGLVEDLSERVGDLTTALSKRIEAVDRHTETLRLTMRDLENSLSQEVSDREHAATGLEDRISQVEQQS